MQQEVGKSPENLCRDGHTHHPSSLEHSYLLATLSVYKNLSCAWRELLCSLSRYSQLCRISSLKLVCNECSVAPTLCPPSGETT